MSLAQRIGGGPALAGSGLQPNTRKSVHRFTDSMRGASVARKASVARNEKR